MVVLVISYFLTATVFLSYKQEYTSNSSANTTAAPSTTTNSNSSSLFSSSSSLLPASRSSTRGNYGSNELPPLISSIFMKRYRVNGRTIFPYILPHFVAVRESPSHDSKVRVKVPHGTIISVRSESSEDYSEIVYPPILYRGWVRTDRLEELLLLA
eukprot:gene29167-38232_t